MTIDVIGIGLDGAEGLTDRVRQLVEKAAVLVGSDRHLNYFPSHPAQKVVLGDFLTAIERVRQYDCEGKSIAILASGDPLFFGLGRLILEVLPPENIRFYPHLNSVQLAFSRLKVPWQDAKFISLHGRSFEELTPLLQQGVEKIAILTDRVNSPSAIARFYQSLDLAVDYDFYVCENLGDRQEGISLFSDKEIAKLLATKANNFSPLNVVILLRQNPGSELEIENLPLLGLPDKTFLSFPDRPGLMTKREIRLAILGELALQPGQIVWDVGAGTGSVSLEIARLCPTSTVYAIEKTGMGRTLIEKNCQRLKVTNVVPVQGNAPEIVANLPSPDRIFIGGSGGNLIEILAECEARLKPHSILVLALATLENLHESLCWLKEKNWDYRLLELHISRSIAVGNLTRFSPLNPVTIVTASFPES